MSEHAPAEPSPAQLVEHLTTLTDVEEDNLFDALSSTRRRHVLTVLLTEARPVGRVRLASEVAALETGTGSERRSDELEREVRLSLHHVHLPKLSRAGFVAIDEDRDLVWPGWTLPIADPVLRTE
ncbi:hypothetical protein HUG10_11875 [Halorarum halophilum]|uniref:DUF7344 domain-containing protein n=1 Tax=Halorarum halophilum TaxID=2743090 RepID=A0A7D5GCF7_9EURY|nr:hypothetical protein [Halobaculum halophilum]QLG28206.1 hypothetical protein HUG10_11875 [Halobaculum halophilum]